MSARLSFHLVDWMRRPARQELTLAPGERRTIEFTAALDVAILDVQQTTTTLAEVSLSFAAGENRVSLDQTLDVYEELAA